MSGSIEKTEGPAPVPRRYGPYLAILLILTPLLWAITYAAMFTASNLACTKSLSGGNSILGYCETAWFGDYEHAAIALDLEPAFARNVRAADVLFLGDSRMQTAASTEAVHHYFTARRVPYYVFGFGYGETAPFPLAMLKRIGARPKIVFVNGDGFFTDRTSPVAAEMLAENRWSRLGTYARYWPKRTFQRHGAALCRIAGRFCAGRSQPRSWMRSLDDGRWTWINGDPNKADRIIADARDKTFDPGTAARQQAIGPHHLATLRALGVRPECVVVTGVPNPLFHSEEMARTTAAALRLPLIQPALTGLGARDGLHLTQPSAELWSAALLRDAGPIIAKCLAGAG